MLLHEAAATANLRATYDALAQCPGDINLLDEHHRPVLFCAIVGYDLRKPSPPSSERNAILKAIISCPELSIYALNAAMDCAMGATPLVLACRLGRVDQVMILLECPSVLVNTRDASGLTPLMLLPQRSTNTDAVHAKSIRIVAALLRSGAKVEILDPFQRSVFEYSKNPTIRTHLENQLRHDRNPRSTPPRNSSRSNRNTYTPALPSPAPKPTAPSTSSEVFGSATPDTLHQLLIRAVNIEDLSLLNSCIEIVVDRTSRPSSPGIHASQPLHFSIINDLDESGLAPIHHAMKCRTPKFAIIDALYAAGADVNLLTSSQRSPLQVLVDTFESGSAEENYALNLLVRHLIQDLQASILRRDEQLETCLHLAAERGSCRELLEALVSCDVEGNVRELKNKRSLRPVDVAKTQYRDVFGERPDSMCTLRPLRTKRSLGSVSSLSSFTSVSSMASVSTVTSLSSHDQPEPQVVGMSLQEALKGSQTLLDEIDLSLLQRTLFYRSSLDIDRAKYASAVVDKSLSQTSSAVIAYWNSCLSIIREELDATHKLIVKSHLLVARTKREVEQKTREDERELTEAMTVWEAQQEYGEKLALKEQTRGRAFTAPARMAESPSDSDSSQKFWMLPYKKWSISGTTTPSEATTISPTETTSTGRSSRVASFIKQKLRPISRCRTPASSERASEPSTPTMEHVNHSLERSQEDDSVTAEIGHQMSPPRSVSSYSADRTLARSVSTRGTIRKAPVQLTRLHTELLRMEEYCRGIHALAIDFQTETAKAEQLIHHCLLRCAEAGEEEEYEDERELERLRTILLVGLESKVDEMCSALEVVRKWNGLVRSLLREFRRKIKGSTHLDNRDTATAT